jgi:hypothetical protein
MGKLFGAGLVVVTLAMTLVFAHSRAFGQAVKSADPIFGRWMMDQSKSVNNPHSARADIGAGRRWPSKHAGE